MRRSGDFLKMFRHERSSGEGECALFLVGTNPWRGKHIVQQRTVGRREGLQVKVRRPTGKGGRSIGRDADKLEALGEHLVVAGFDLVGEQEEQMRLLAIVGRVHKNSALTEEIAVLFQNQVAHGEHQRVAGMEHCGEGRAWLVERPDSFAGETDALVTLEHGSEFAAVTAGDDAVALADGGRNMRDLEAGGLSRMNGTAQCLEGFHEE